MIMQNLRQILYLWCVLVGMLTFVGCDVSTGQERLAHRSCWTFPRNPAHDDEIEARIRKFGETIGAKVLGTGVQVEVRNTKARYYAIYNRYMPAFGRIIHTYWSKEGNYPYNNWDKKLKLSLSAIAKLSPCRDDYKSWISG